ncbi:response regulator [Actomonas aquatica]|uniref:Response regulator n=1 Tax=Actomonas aquatica TaxID=2866162 RepID=A0ABZ1CAD2_9BACT|nr:response regulator [Opitutus sp. WL0086]WRQ88649.1 response regulator [Opitutus sp. WL0086]
MSAAADNGAETSKPAILIVDDETALLDVMAARLADDYEVEIANSAAEADVQMGLQHFDVVLVDHLMPGELGLDFLMRVREHFPQTKRILVTGYLNPELISRAQTLAELSAYLIKPVNAQQLKAAVAGALAV